LKTGKPIFVYGEPLITEEDLLEKYELPDEKKLTEAEKNGR
jgi:hypothetical protein